MWIIYFSRLDSVGVLPERNMIKNWLICNGQGRWSSKYGLRQTKTSIECVRDQQDQ